MDITKRFQQIFKKYVAGEANPVEQHIVERWYESLEEDATHPPALDGGERERDLQQRLLLKVLPSKPVYQWYRKPVWQVAAVLLLGGAALLVWRAGYMQSQKQLIAVTTESARQPSVIRTGIRQVKKVQLIDSTVVWLNAESTLTVDANYGDGSRHVKLDGEALFDVRRDTAQVFNVSLKDIQVRVLGTSFNVRAYPELQDVVVNVLEGSVQIDDSERIWGVLGKGEELTYDTRRRHATISEHARPRDEWTKGVVHLERASFDELARALRNTHGVELKTRSSSAKQYRYNVVIRTDQDIENILTTISQSLNKTYKKEGKYVTIM